MLARLPLIVELTPTLRPTNPTSGQNLNARRTSESPSGLTPLVSIYIYSTVTVCTQLNIYDVGPFGYNDRAFIHNQYRSGMQGYNRCLHIEPSRVEIVNKDGQLL